METDEIVRALKEMLPSQVDYAELVGSPVPSSYGVCYVREDPEPYHISAAIDLIESLQSQLAESQRRERAAGESLKRKCLDERAAVKCICDIETYLELGSAKYIKKAIDAWRGPQEAGKGDAE